MDNVHRIMASQSDLKAACETIEAYQSELENDLNSLSNNLDLELEALQIQVMGVRKIYVFFCLRMFALCIVGIFEPTTFFNK